MKAIKLFLAVAVAMVAASCEKSQDVELSEAVKMHYSVAIDAVAGSRAFDGSNIDKLDYKVYRLESAESAVATTFAGTVDKNAEGKFDVTLEFLKGQQYKVTFFAYNSAKMGDNNCCKYADANKDAVVFDHSKGADDVFAGVFTLSAEDTNTTLPLYRPLAQVNLYVAADHITKAESLGFTATGAEVSFSLAKMATTYNLLTKAVSGTSDEVSYTGAFGAAADGYHAIGSALVLAGQNVDGKIATVSGTGFAEITLDKSVPSVPTQANYKTNIRYSSLLLGSVAYEVTLEKDFAGEKNYDQDGNEVQ